MSIQDESFPNDLEFSCDSGKSFVFPHHNPRRSNILSNKETNEQHELLEKVDISSSSPLQNQDDSTQSSNDFCLSSETSGKTNASEPNDSENKKPDFVRQNPSKSTSYQDIHSEYTKRRYKHVESKVGQYIANIKAQDEKRRNSGKFQRHRSMPETLHERETTEPELNNDSKKLGLLRRSTNDLDRVHKQGNDVQSDQDIDNYDNLTTTTSSVSTKDLALENGILLDKQTYEQLLNVKERNDYLQNKLEEKNAENWRLKQNLDIIRIEYTLCKDKLKQQTQAQRFSGSVGSINAAATLGRTSLQSLLYPQETREKSTQTDKVLTPSPIPLENNAGKEMFATPLTPDSNNNTFDHAAVGIFAPHAHKVYKSIATIQPLSLNFSNLVDQDLNGSNINTTMSFLRQRSNSLAARKKSTPNPTNISKNSSAGSSVPSSSDSAIEVAESPKTQRQNRRAEFVYYEQHSQRCAVEENHSAASNYIDTENSSCTNNTTESVIGGTKRNCRKRRNFRSRMMRFFGACAKCEDPNMSLEPIDAQHSQIPLLEKSTPNYCHNVR